MGFCCCEQPPFNYRDYETTNLGMDSDYADVSIDICKRCGSHWLNYLIEEEHRTKSGRWWRVRLGVKNIEKEHAKDYIEKQKTGFIGGSYYGHAGKLYDYGPIEIR